MQSWPMQDAERHFSDVLDASLREGPQLVTRDGVELAVVVRIDQWRRLELAQRPSLEDILLAPEPRCDDLLGMRPTLARRLPPGFE